MMLRFGAAACLLTACLWGQEFQLGSKVTDFSLAGMDGGAATYASLKAPVTVVVFMSTRCPVSNAYNERMNAVYQDYSAKGVRFLFVNANFNESVEDMAAHVKAHDLKFPVYKDDGNATADRFGASVTPEAFVIAGDVIRYHGSIDDAQNPARVQKQNLRLALDAVLASQPVTTAETKAFGCTIKRKKAS
jgi:peroxiredoxin